MKNEKSHLCLDNDQDNSRQFRDTIVRFWIK